MLDFVNDLPIALQAIIYIIALGIGVFFLVKFSDIFVDNASAIAKKLHISEMIIGLTIVAMGTSCPELAVSASDSVTALINSSHANVAIGNVVGSNICNILLVLGVSCLFTPIAVKKENLRREYPFLLAITIICVIFGIFWGEGDEPYAINRIEGIILVALIFVYIAFLIFFAKKDAKAAASLEKTEPISAETGNEEKKDESKLWMNILLVILGAAGIVVGGEAVVYGAKGIALLITDSAGVDHDLAESLLGLTVVAVGTSLPELVTSAVASKKGQNELALGNVIGSNIFNIVFVLGIASVINPLVTGSQVVIDLLIMLGVTLVAFGLAFRKKYDRISGIILLSLYACDLTYLIIRTFVA